MKSEKVKRLQKDEKTKQKLKDKKVIGGSGNNSRFALTMLTTGRKTDVNADLLPGLLREVGLHLLPKSLLVEEALKAVPNPMYFPVLDTATVGNLKRRVRGLTDVPIRRMMVVYRGAVLADTATIPTDAFEAKHPLSFFDDLYRPKLFLRVFSAVSVARDGEDDVDSFADNVAESDGDGDEMDNDDADVFVEDYVEELDAATEGQQQPSVAEESHAPLLDEHQLVKYLKEQTFDLRAELQKIECEPFFEALHAAGYADEVRVCVQYQAAPSSLNDSVHSLVSFPISHRGRAPFRV